MTIRYFVEKKVGPEWENCDLRAGHVSYAYCRRLAIKVKNSNPKDNVRVICRITKTDEFTVEEI